MKISLFAAGLLVVVAIGYYIFVQSPSAETLNTDSQAKVDMNAVCDGALAYMSFPSGAEAEVWVAECKRGEHPEAIEQWKVQMGITDDRAI